MDYVDRVRRYLEDRGLPGRVLEFDVSSATVELAARALHCQCGMIAKTLSFMAGDRPVLIVMAGDARTDNRRYKDQFGCKARMMTEEELREHTGLAFGGVCPFDLPPSVELYLDESLLRHEVIYPAAGSPSSAVRMTPGELESVVPHKGWIRVSRDMDTNT